MIHVWGPPDSLGLDERLCTEPLTPAIQVTYHPRFQMLPHGDCVCLTCGERFEQSSSEPMGEAS
jgi:hypothetical protein